MCCGFCSLSPLVRKVHDAQVDEIMVELCNGVLKGKDEQRDICSIGVQRCRLRETLDCGYA